jgi:hypothetical protein
MNCAAAIPNPIFAQAAPGALASSEVADFQIDANATPFRRIATHFKRGAGRITSFIFSLFLADTAKIPSESSADPSLKLRTVMGCAIGGVGDTGLHSILSLPLESLSWEIRPVRASHGSGGNQAAGSYSRPTPEPDVSS